MCGLRSAGIFRMPSPQLWELGMQLGFLGREEAGGVSGTQVQFRNTLQPEVRGRNKTGSFNTSSVHKYTHFLEGCATFIYFVRQPIAYYKEFFCRVSFFKKYIEHRERNPSVTGVKKQSIS